LDEVKASRPDDFLTLGKKTGENHRFWQLKLSHPNPNFRIKKGINNMGNLHLLRSVLCALTLLLATTVIAQPKFDTIALLQHLKTLSSDAYEGRGTMQQGNIATQDYIVNEFAKMGLSKVADEYTIPFNFLHPIKKEKMTGVNIAGMVKGKKYPEKYIVVTAHYDHLGKLKGKIYNGADDNGSGTCALFAIASWLTKNQPDHSIIFVAFDAEEISLEGSEDFVTKPPVPIKNMVLNINMDMIGRNVNNEIYICGTSHNKSLKPLLAEPVSKSPLKVSFGHDKRKSRQDDWTQSSDHGPFHNKGIPFLYFGEEDHPDYHKPTDDFESIMPTFYINAASLILETIITLDATKEYKE
jgi:hypothetical protein